MTENNTKSMQAEKAALLGEVPGKTTTRRLILGTGIAAVAVALGAWWWMGEGSAAPRYVTQAPVRDDLTVTVTATLAESRPES